MCYSLKWRLVISYFLRLNVGAEDLIPLNFVQNSLNFPTAIEFICELYTLLTLGGPPGCVRFVNFSHLTGSNTKGVRWYPMSFTDFTVSDRSRTHLFSLCLGKRAETLDF